MEREQVIALLLLYRRLKKRRAKRLHWVHPINQKRKECGDFYVLFHQLREDPDKFFNYFRMSATTFDELHERLKVTLQRQDTFMRECIQPEQMLAVTLR